MMKVKMGKLGSIVAAVCVAGFAGVAYYAAGPETNSSNAEHLAPADDSAVAQTVQGAGQRVVIDENGNLVSGRGTDTPTTLVEPRGPVVPDVRASDVPGGGFVGDVSHIRSYTVVNKKPDGTLETVHGVTNVDEIPEIVEKQADRMEALHNADEKSE